MADEVTETGLTIGSGGKQITLPTFADIISGAVPMREFTGDLEVVDKDRLIGVPFYVVGWAIHPVEGTDRGFASVYIMRNETQVELFNDGGTGIPPILEQIEAKHGNPLDGNPAVACAKGLRKSDYVNEHGPATTYYFA